MLKFFPLLLVVVILYNIVAFGGSAGLGIPANETLESGEQAFNAALLMNQVAFNVPMPSGMDWLLTYGDFFILIGLVILFIELIRSTSHDASAITNHALSLGVLVLCIIEFVIVPGFATSTFFFITLMAGIDVVAGFIISIRAARRDFAVGGNVIGT